jgi:2',3'-cyclic-nucleotide 2'-phosphodiesterase (5'-nucleotidase family)
MRYNPLSLVTLVLLVACAGPAGPRGAAPSAPQPAVEVEPPAVPPGRLAVVEAPVAFTVVEAAIEDDPAVEAVVAPFRDRMGEEVSQVIGETTGMLSKAWPEGTLGNFATDAMLWAANQEVGDSVHMAMTNDGGLRIPIGPGPITVGQMYELMPFENMLSILVLSGPQVKELCDEVADRRGTPIAGFSFRIVSRGDARTAQDILIGGEPLDLDSHYRLVTNDYMANGGDSFPALLDPVARIDLPVLVRDAFIEYVREKGRIEPNLEGRITGGIGR